VELRHLRYFLAVAEQLHFRRAAKSLETSQPSLSLQIRTLEAELGVRLFERTKRSVRLTAAGKLYEAEVRRILADLEAANQRALEAARGTRGELTLATSIATLMSYFPRIVRRFRATYPDVTLRMHMIHAVELVDALVARRVQLGFVQVPPNAERLLSEPLWEHRFVVALPADHPAAGHKAVNLRALSGERLIAYARTSSASIAAEVDALCTEQHFVPGAVEEVAETTTVFGLVACGNGIAIMPAHVQSVAPPGILFKPLDPPSARRMHISACWHRAEDSPLIAAFITIARETGLPSSEQPVQETGEIPVTH
jgi:DNA-binding transcriptional LysR family regulator